MTHELPEGTIRWKNYACRIEITEKGGYCLQVYSRDRDGERWSHSQLAAATLGEFSTQLAAAFDAAHRRGVEQGLEQVRVALGFPSGSMRR